MLQSRANGCWACPFLCLSAASSTRDRKSTRLNSSHSQISYAVFCLKKKSKDDKALGVTVPHKLLYLTDEVIRYKQSYCHCSQPLTAHRATSPTRINPRAIALIADSL